MHSFTVYEFGSREFRVVSDEHTTHENAVRSIVRVYQNTDAVSAAITAYVLETRSDIRAQIARFIPTNRLPDHPGTGSLESNSVSRLTSAGADSAAVAVNSGGATLHECKRDV